MGEAGKGVRNESQMWMQGCWYGARLGAVGQGWILEMGYLWHHGIARLLSRVL